MGGQIHVHRPRVMPDSAAFVHLAKAVELGHGAVMCVVALAWKAHPKWRLIIAGNRDEFHARAAAPLARWEAPAHVIAGRDLQAGGSWLGVSDEGRVAVVTNVRSADGPDPSLASRGELVSGFLAGAGRYAALETADLGDFNAFNLLIATSVDAHLLTNRPDPARAPLPPGIHSVSNGEVNEPWPRRDAIEAAMRDWINAGAANPYTLFGALGSELPLGPDSPPVFIRAPVYGTRCSSVIAVDAEGSGQIIERRFDAHGQPLGEVAQDFSWAV